MTSRIDARLLIERLAATRPPEDPRAVELPAATRSWPADLAASLATELTPAAVLIPVFEREVGLTVLLTERSAALRHHAGQIAFPGGRMEAHDADVAMTALRETHEEVGIDPGQVAVAGYLRPMPTITGFAVTPVIGVVEPTAPITIDRTEVQEAFEVPLDFLLDAGNERKGQREYQGRRIPVLEFRYERFRIWGATAHMLLELRELVLKQ